MNAKTDSKAIQVCWAPKKKKRDNLASVKQINQALEIKKSVFVLDLSLIEMQNKEFIFGPILSKVALLQCKTTTKKMSIQNFKWQSWFKRKH